jgi:hypothetical protein
MKMHDTERSLRIVAEATRVIELTRRIDTALDTARSLIRERHATANSLARLADADLAIGTGPVAPEAIDTALAVVAGTRGDGIDAEALTGEIMRLTGLDVTPTELKAAVRPHLIAGRITLTSGVYRQGKGRANRRHAKGAVDAPTDRDMVLEVLRASDVPLGVASIMQAVERRFGERIPRTSVSPLLAKLRDAGGIVLHVGGKWTIPEAPLES